MGEAARGARRETTMREFDAILFDMDGTLVDSEPLHALAWTRTVESFGLTPPPGDWTERFVGGTDAKTLQGVVGMFPALAGIDGILERKRLIFRELVAGRGSALVMPGLVSSLRQLGAAGYRMAVGTNAVLVNCRAVLRAAGLLQYFAALSTFDLVERAKPAPDIYLAAASRLQCPPERCIVVEDSAAGAAAGKAAGCHVVGIASTAAQRLDAADVVLPGSAAALDWIVDRLASGAR